MKKQSRTTWTLNGTELTISKNTYTGLHYYSTLPWGTDITKVIIEDGVTSISDYAFKYCSNLTSIVIPDSIKCIGHHAFCGCINLKKVYISDIRAWCNISFGNFTANPLACGAELYLNDKIVTKLIIPDGVTSIKNYAFLGCSSLTNIVIPDSVTNIRNCAFQDCLNLVNVIIGNGVESVSQHAFWGCFKLVNVNIGNSVTSIGERAFYYCKSLTSIVIPNSITNIGSFAFYECKIKSKTKNYKACKIINNKFICLDQEYQMNKWSQKITDIRLCSYGYHFCTNLYEIFNYYGGKIDKDIAIFECEVGDEVIVSPIISKCVTDRIKLVKRLTKDEIIEILNNPIK